MLCWAEYTSQLESGLQASSLEKTSPPGPMVLTSVAAPKLAPSKGAKSYIIECAPYNTPRVWQQVKITTRSSFTVTGLTPGATYVFRVKAIGSAGESDWSDEAVKMAP